MGHMSNAPLIYTLGIIKFTRVPDFAKFTDKFFEKIRVDYPYDEKLSQKLLMGMEMGPTGLVLNHKDTHVWQYLSPNRDCGFLLSDEFLCFHTNNYKDSKAFLDRFAWGLQRFKSIPELQIPFITMIGIRYLDLVVPEDGNKLTDYLKKWVLPEEAPNEGMKILEGAYMAKYQTDLGILNFQAVRNPDTIFPPDLQSPFLQKNGWVKKRPKDKEFAVVDTDHFIATPNMQEPFDVGTIIQKLDQLHLQCKKVFLSFGTDDAFKFWQGEK